MLSRSQTCSQTWFHLWSLWHSGAIQIRLLLFLTCHTQVRAISTAFELSGHVEIAQTWSQTGSGHIPLCYLALRSARKLIADLLPSWSQAEQHNEIWSRTGLRPASELDSVMEIGLRHAHDVYMQVFAQLDSGLWTSSRAGHRPAPELDSVMEIGLRHAHDVYMQVFTQLASSLRTSSWADHRPACELVASCIV